jgi:hypothetical protein
VGKNFDGLRETLTETMFKAGTQTGFLIVLEQLPNAQNLTRKQGKPCWTCSATLPITGPTKSAIPGVLLVRVSPSPRHPALARAFRPLALLHCNNSCLLWPCACGQGTMPGYEKHRHPYFRSRQQHGSHRARAPGRALAGPYCRRHQQPRRCARPGFAAEHGIATAVVANKDYASRAEFDAALQAVIDGFRPIWWCWPVSCAS